jgi:hypothetical protein
MGGIILRRTNELPSINLCQLGNKGLNLGYHSVTAQAQFFGKIDVNVCTGTSQIEK